MAPEHTAARRGGPARLIANWSVTAKTMPSVVLIGSVAIGVGLLGLVKLNAASAAAKAVHAHGLKPLVHVEEIRRLSVTISADIAPINDYQVTITSAVEEQTATTQEMNRSVSEAATGSGEIAASIAGVAHSTMSGVAESQRAVAELTRISTDLTSLVARFTV